MSTLAVHMSSPKSLKRTYDDAGLGESLQISPTPRAQPVPSSGTDTPNDCLSQRSTDIPALSSSAPSAAGLPSSTPTPSIEASAKKTKLTFGEKEVQRIETEFKARQKADEKARKVEEKAKKEAERAQKEVEKGKREEEKKAKDAVKEEKREAKEAQALAKQEEKRLKEEEKQRQEEAKNKKARNQLRLNSFFIQPSMPNGASSGSPTREAHSPLSSRRSSISEIQAMEASRRSRSVSNTPKKGQSSDYERHFQPFYKPLNTILAPCNRLSPDANSLACVQKIDEALLIKQEIKIAREGNIPSIMRELLHLPLHRENRRRAPAHTVKDIMVAIDGSVTNPIHLTDLKPKLSTKRPMDILRTIPVKFLKFPEDVRPPYVGTYTRLQNDHSNSHVARNPFSRSLPKTDYDYDSEAEWEEPVEGEDLDSEGEEEPEDDEEGDDMVGFLDDEEATHIIRAVKRRPVLRDQEPISTGICWDGPQGLPYEQGFANLDRHRFKLDILMENPQLPIDPYSTHYWLPTGHSTSLDTPPRTHNTLMEPPRVPLHPVNRQSSVNKASQDAKSNFSAPMKPAKIHRLIAPDLMDDFKAAVQGNDLTKVGLLEILKKKFPKEPKDAIKDTLEMIAERVGPRPSEKKWILKSGN